MSYSFVDGGRGGCHIDVFDDDAEGNGSTQLADKYFHVPIEVRELAEHFDDKNLPSGSFLEVLERTLQMCPEHILHTIATSDSGSAPKRSPKWLQGESDEPVARFGPIWSELGVSDTREASLHNRRRFAIAAGQRGPSTGLGSRPRARALPVRRRPSRLLRGRLRQHIPPHSLRTRPAGRYSTTSWATGQTTRGT